MEVEMGLKMRKELPSCKMVSQNSDFELVVFQRSSKLDSIQSWLNNTSYSYSTIDDEGILLDEGIYFAPNLVILDHDSPNNNCYRLIHALRKKYDGPIIIMTAGRNIHDFKNGRFDSVDMVIFKPVSRGNFLEILNRYASGQNGSCECKIPKSYNGKLFLDEADRICSSLHKSGLPKNKFAKKRKMSVSKLDNETRIASLSSDVKEIIQEYPNVFVKKKSFFSEHLYRLATADIILIMREIIEHEKNGQKYTIEMLKNRIVNM
jgi:DNA-binding response OmpR family regulator